MSQVFGPGDDDEEEEDNGKVPSKGWNGTYFYGQSGDVYLNPADALRDSQRDENANSGGAAGNCPQDPDTVDNESSGNDYSGW